MSQNGKEREGIAELETGLKGLGLWLELLPDGLHGDYWDPRGNLKRAIEVTQGLLRDDSVNLARVDEHVRQLGENFEEEIELVREDLSSTYECNDIGI